MAIVHDKKVIRAHVPISEERRDKIGYALAVAAKENNLDDYEVKVRAIREGDPIAN